MKDTDNKNDIGREIDKFSDIIEENCFVESSFGY